MMNGNHQTDDFVKDIEPKETVKGPRGHLSSIVADDVSEINNNIKEAGGYYTQPVYAMIKKHGYPKVMHGLLTSLDADVIQDFISRADLDEASLNESGPDESVKNIDEILVKMGAEAPSDIIADIMHWIDAHPGENLEDLIRQANGYYNDEKNETKINEFGPDERYMKIGNNTMIANKKTGSVSSTLSLGGDKSATVNNHLNRDGSAGKVSARGTVNVSGNPVKFKASNSISGNNFKGSVSAGGMTVNASKKPKMKKEGKYVSDAQRKAVHASKAEKK